MLKRLVLQSLLFSCGALASSASPAPLVQPAPSQSGAEEALKAAEHEALGKQIARYIEAFQENKGIDKARAGISDELEKLKKKLKGRDPLSLDPDLGKALWQAFAYEGQKGVKKGKVSAVEVDVPFYGDGYKLEYAVHAPAKYDPRKAYPLLLCLPDKGEKPTDHLTEKWIAPELRDNVIFACVPLPDDVALWTETGAQGKPGGVGNLLTVMREMTRIYAVDFDRVFLAGRGAGVGAAVTIAARFPDRFAGVIGRSGDVGETAPDNFKNLPSFFGGAGAGATAFAEKAEKLGYANTTLKPETQETDVWSWMQAQVRASNPADVVLIPGTPFPNKAYWLEVPPFDGQGKAHIAAKIDRGTNTITVDGEGVTGVTLFLNDTLVDLEKPVKVVCNGVEHIDVIPRNLAMTLELITNSRSDPGKLYTAKKAYDLPEKVKPK